MLNLLVIFLLLIGCSDDTPIDKKAIQEHIEMRSDSLYSFVKDTL